jgi:hypothetical protein
MCTKLWERLEERKVNYFPFALYLKLILGSRVAGFIEAEVGLKFGYLGILELKKEIFLNIIYYTAHSALHVSIAHFIYWQTGELHYIKKDNRLQAIYWIYCSVSQ